MSDLRGRFHSGLGDEMARFSSSLPSDLRIAEEDVRGSIAHATMLGETGILTADEAARLVHGLEQVRDELRRGLWSPDPAHEDIHMAVEARLTEIVGELGGKLHTARSRNDQIATDVRLWLKRVLGELDRAARELVQVLLDRVEADGRTLLAGYTHLQRGQPILLGHQLLAHAWALTRDRERFADAHSRVDRSPLGACALAGTPHPIDRRRTAALLGFSGVLENAMDAVAARDHVQEVAAACAIAMAHLSRMAEELVLWSTREFDFVRLDDAWSTGSSIMPQKRNPDAAELVRGKASRVQGDVLALLSLVKALPLAYNRDLQEDRPPLYDAVDTTCDSLRAMAGMWRTLEIRTDRFEHELAGDPSLATEIADWLAARGMPFRRAHELVARLALLAEERGVGFDRLEREELMALHPDLPDELERLLDPRAAAERRVSLGGTAWSEISRQVALLRAAAAPSD